MFLCRKVVFFSLISQDHITSTKGERTGRGKADQLKYFAYCAGLCINLYNLESKLNNCLNN